MYGLLFNEQNEILVAEEKHYDTCIRKFPGGGLQFGEGLIDALKREFREELNLNIEVVNHFYTTDFFVQSAFNPLQQVISIFYIVKTDSLASLFLSDRKPIEEMQNGNEQFYWINPTRLSTSEFTFPIEKRVCELLKVNYKGE